MSKKYLIYLPQDIAEAGKHYLLEKGYVIRIGTASDEDTILRESSDADGILVRTAKITRAIIENATQLKVISRHGTGVDNIDIEAAREHGIYVTNGPESNTNAVAEHVVAFVLACAYHIPILNNAVRRGDWDIRNRLRMTEISGKQAGFIGFGRIGQLTAQKLHDGLGMRIIAWSPHIGEKKLPTWVEKASSMEEVLKNADFISLNCPASGNNYHMINHEQLALMKPEAYLINCGRGALVNENALTDALREGTICGAALDCLETEPPETDLSLFGLENVILSPHCSSHSQETFNRMALHAAIGIDEVLSRKPITWRVY